MAATVWTPTRKFLGNFIPGFLWLTMAVLGVYLIVTTHEMIGPGLWVLLLGTAVSWLALNSFGLFQNKSMRMELERILGADTDLPKNRVFVGFSTPKYTGLMDAHEDVGFLCLTKDSLIFVGEQRSVDIDRIQITRVSFRPNVHTLVGLGRWICIDGVANGAPVRMLVESRESSTMLTNLLQGKALCNKIETWRSNS